MVRNCLTAINYLFEALFLTLKLSFEQVHEKCEVHCRVATVVAPNKSN